MKTWLWCDWNSYQLLKMKITFQGYHQREYLLFNTNQKDMGKGKYISQVFPEKIFEHAVLKFEY